MRHSFSFSFALYTDRVFGCLGDPAGQQVREEVHQHFGAWRAPVDVAVHLDHLVGGVGRHAGVVVTLVPVDHPPDLVELTVRRDGVDTGDGGAGPHGDQDLRMPPDLVKPFDTGRRGDRALDKSHVKIPTGLGHGLAEIDNLHVFENAEEFVFHADLCQLTPLAPREVEERDTNFPVGIHMASFTPWIAA